MSDVDRLEKSLDELKTSFAFWRGAASVLLVVVPVISLIFVGYEWWSIPRKVDHSAQRRIEELIGKNFKVRIANAVANADEVDRIVKGTARQFFASGVEEDSTDNGLIGSRSLKIRKQRPDTAIRIGYTDNLRVQGTSGRAGACKWEIKFDGTSCPGGSLVYTYYAPPGANPHRSRHVVGYCEGLAIGTHALQVWASQIAEYEGSDCYTGWYGGRWTIEAEEVLIQKVSEKPASTSRVEPHLGSSEQAPR